MPRMAIDPTRGIDALKVPTRGIDALKVKSYLSQTMHTHTNDDFMKTEKGTDSR